MVRKSFLILSVGLWPLSALAVEPAQVQSSNSSFNPAVSLILNGTYADLQRNPDEYFIPGFALGPETEPGTRGFGLGESELVMSANADNRFLGYFTAVLTPDNEVAVEEAFVQTIGLSEGLTLRAGRFFSGIGYMNEQHPHVFDFVDTALPYRALLANQYGDDGVQLRWLAPTELFVELGVEAFRGDNYPAAGASRDGRGAYTAFVHVGGDVGESHSWRAGVSRLQARAQDRESDDPVSGEVLTFTGKSNVTIVDFVWKWAPNGNATVTNFKLQGEYLQRDENGAYTSDGGTLSDTPYDAAQSGWYLQGVYQFRPRWRAGLRHDRVHAQAVPAAYVGTSLDPAGHDAYRNSVMLDFSNSEFSRVRVQYNDDHSRPQADNQFFLQYIVSIGSHGAHKF